MVSETEGVMMTVYEITTIESTGTFSTDGHFNVNVLPGANTGETPWGGNDGNPLGAPTQETLNALSEFRVDYTRFPAGQEKEAFSNYGIVINGQLSDFLDEYLSHAHEHGMKVSLVVPVETLEPYGGVGAAELYDQLAAMSQLIGEQYPGTVASYELGNEYWIKREPGDETREVDYGAGAAQAAVALKSGMDASGDSAAILIQACGNLGGSYGNDIGTANAAIQNAFEKVADPNGLIDGVVRNFYWRDSGQGGFQDDSGIFAEDRGLSENFDGGAAANWEDWVGTELLRVVGEFNINRNMALRGDEVDIGIHGASFLLEHYTNLVEAEVDFSFAWPIIHSTQNAYLNRHEDIVIETVNGYDVVVNSTRAAMFDILGEVTVGLELLNTDWTATEGAGDLEITVFSSPLQSEEMPQRSEIFISSRTSEADAFTVDLSSVIDKNAELFAYIVGYAQTGGNHRNAELRTVDLGSAWIDGTLEVFLNPYEVLHITSVEPSTSPVETVNEIPGTAADDFFLGLEGADSISGEDGDDVLIGEGGNDFIQGGDGDDTILGSLGDDRIRGGHGADVLDGGEGSDTAIGGDGSDTILGYGGRDELEGGAGQDFLVGGVGEDTILGGNGDDRIHGQEDNDSLMGGVGNDTIFGDNGFDFLQGDAGQDLLIGGGNSDSLRGGDGADELIGDWGFDTLDGGAGSDTLNGGSGADVLTGGLGEDLFYFDNFDDRLDRVTDFQVGEDLLVFNTGGFGGDFNGVEFIAYDGGESTVVRFLNSNEIVDKSLGGIILDGVDHNGISASDLLVF
ncbi:calcium-binding protein [Gymnodinialimonas hymeniacidonis]|uniref:calcium-binding protein n=1 Tax=Gymnodinialimonas hymeniacidonis TaxID=3126508 RepID=UPI0034C6C0B0